MIDPDTGEVTCDECAASIAPSEDAAEAAGRFVEAETEAAPNRHLCPGCQELRLH
jgi:hypothetical protein